MIGTGVWVLRATTKNKARKACPVSNQKDRYGYEILRNTESKMIINMETMYEMGRRKNHETTKIN